MGRREGIGNAQQGWGRGKVGRVSGRGEGPGVK